MNSVGDVTHPYIPYHRICNDFRHRHHLPQAWRSERHGWAGIF